MNDLFVGTWKLNPARSTLDAHHRPTEGTMRWQRETNGAYLLEAEGLDAKGNRVAERPQRLIPDGLAYPVPDFHGLTAITSQPDGHTLRAEVRREDSTVVGEGSYVVSADGTSLVATTDGFDAQLRRFEMHTVWERQ